MVLKLYLEGFPATFRMAINAVCFDFDFSVVEDKAQADLRVFVDPKDLSRFEFSRDVLILAEPEVVRPDLYRRRIFAEKLMILPLGRYRADRLGLSSWVDFPVELPNYKRVRLARNSKIVLVNEHKFSSSHRSQYGLRREIIRYLERTSSSSFDLYGSEWNSAKILEFRRRVAALLNNKSLLDVDLKETFSDLWHTYSVGAGHMHQDCEPLQNYRASICIENDIDYISEKVWKSLYAGCPVFYVGPNLTYDRDLEQCVLFSEANIESLIFNVNSFDENTGRVRANAGLDFLNSSQFLPYCPEYRARGFFSSLKKIAGI